jgi:agmatine deiminase
MSDALPAAAGFRLAAGWESLEAVWLARPADEQTWPGCLDKARMEWENFATRLRDAVEIRELASLGIVASHSAIRDVGPAFMVHPEHGVAAVAFRRDRHDERAAHHDLDRGVPEAIASRSGLPVFECPLPLDGGSLDTDGLGTLLVAEACLGAARVRSGLDRDGFESKLRETLGASSIVWLSGAGEDGGVGPRLDDLARFVAPGIVAAVDAPPGHPDHSVLSSNRDHLRCATDARGQRLEIVPLPTPTPIHHDFPAGGPGPGGRRSLPASHANFLVANGRIFVPVFGSRSDDLACRRLEDASGLPAVSVMARSLVVGLGSLHRMSCPQPAPPAKA